MAKRKIIESLKKYAARLKKKVNVDDILIYGSFLTKRFNPEKSDLDVIVLSPDFKNLAEDSMLNIIYHEAIGFSCDFHAYGMTREEFENPLRYSSLSLINKKARSLETFNFQ